MGYLRAESKPGGLTTHAWIFVPSNDGTQISSTAPTFESANSASLGSTSGVSVRAFVSKTPSTPGRCGVPVTSANFDASGVALPEMTSRCASVNSSTAPLSMSTRASICAPCRPTAV